MTTGAGVAAFEAVDRRGRAPAGRVLGHDVAVRPALDLGRHGRLAGSLIQERMLPAFVTPAQRVGGGLAFWGGTLLVSVGQYAGSLLLTVAA